MSNEVAFNASEGISRTTLYASIAATVILAWLLPRILQKFQASTYPLVNKSPAWDLFNFTGIVEYVKNGVPLVIESAAKYGGPFCLQTDYGRKLILPPEYIDAINNEPSLDFQAWINSELLAWIPAFAVFGAGQDHMLEEVVRKKLTQNLPKFTEALSKESALALDDKWGPSKEWHEISIKKDNADTIARLSALVFCGERLAHNPDWQKITVDITINAFLGVVECRMFPVWLQPVVARIAPHAVKTNGMYRKGKKLIEEELERRREEIRGAAESGKSAPIFNDAIEWHREVANGQPYDPLMMQMGLALAAIHTSTDLLTQCIYDLCKYPEVLPALRQEIAEVIGAHGWSKLALYELKRLDSFIKESQRLKPAGIANMNRVAVKDVTLNDSVSIRKGDIIQISSHRMWDSSVYEDATTFDPERFIKLREKPGHEHTSHLVSTTRDFTAFSHGKHACPGRFFAANEIKIALAHMIMKYDIMMDDPNSAEPLQFGIVLQSRDNVMVKVRRREAELDM